MKRCFVTVGLGFGDESKGATVDSLCRQFGCDLVVRYSGGHQAGHNVQLPDGTRHTFSQFGAGTLAGAKTYLGPSMIIEPLALIREAAALRKIGLNVEGDLIRIHPSCLVTTPFHKAMNRIREESRRMDRHGSCGVGVGETRGYWLKYGSDALMAVDVFDADDGTLQDKLELLKQRFWLEVMDMENAVVSLENNFYDWSIEDVAQEMVDAGSRLRTSRYLQPHESVVYEGSQGVLLDQTFGFPPYYTWSDVTIRPALEMIVESDYDDVKYIGVTRAYHSRHGEGPLPTESREFTKLCDDPGNPPNPWQGAIRMGWMDFPLLDYAIECCGRTLDGLAISHLDQIDDENIYWNTGYLEGYSPRHRPRLMPMFSMRDREEQTFDLNGYSCHLKLGSKTDLLAEFEKRLPILMTATGPTHSDREWRLK